MNTKEDYSIEEKASLLESIGWLRSFSYQEIQRFSGYLIVEVLAKNIVISKEGEQSKSMSFIINGSVKILKLDDSNQNKEIAIFTKGKTFGEMSLLDGEPGSASVVTIDQVTLMTLDEGRFKSMMEECPGMGIKILLGIARIISTRLRMTSGRLVDYLDGQ